MQLIFPAILALAHVTLGTAQSVSGCTAGQIGVGVFISLDFSVSFSLCIKSVLISSIGLVYSDLQPSL